MGLFFDVGATEQEMFYIFFDKLSEAKHENGCCYSLKGDYTLCFGFDNQIWWERREPGWKYILYMEVLKVVFFEFSKAHFSEL